MKRTTIALALLALSTAPQADTQEAMDVCTSLGIAAAWAQMGADRRWGYDKTLRKIKEESRFYDYADEVTEKHLRIVRYVREHPYSKPHQWESNVSSECASKYYEDRDG